MAKAKTADIIKSHEAMKRFLQSLVRYSDKTYCGNRTNHTERQYQKAVRLIDRAKALGS